MNKQFSKISSEIRQNSCWILKNSVEWFEYFFSLLFQKECKNFLKQTTKSLARNTMSSND